MELGSEVGNAVEQDAQGGLASTIGSQPWWRGPGFVGMSTAVLPQGVSRSHSVEPPLGGGGLKSGQPQLHDGGGDACRVSKEMQNTGNRAGSDGSYGQAHQQMQPVSSTMPPMMPEYLAPHAQLGPSVACAAYTYSDPYYAGLMTAYGNQSMVHPQLPGMPHTRMPLPLEMTEEPVYVNAKQYHGILRRRQSRAKLELEKKLIKARKPYLHESRHQHAMRRERGCGGRFINTKKSAANIANYNASCGANSGASLALKPGSTDTLRMDCSGNSDSASVVLEVGRPGLQGMFEPHVRAISNDRYQEHSGFQLSTFNTKQSEEGNHLGQQRGGILVSRPPDRVVAIK